MLQLHSYEPCVSKHDALASQGLEPHSFTLSHCVCPSPEYPASQLHSYEPAVFAHDAFAAHGPDEHSSTSSHIQPVPVYPASHVHVYDPSVLWHVASAWHGLLSGEHSLASFWHTVPYHPPAHVHTKPLPGADTSAHVPCPLQSCPSQPSMSAQLSPSPK